MDDCIEIIRDIGCQFSRCNIMVKDEYRIIELHDILIHSDTDLKMDIYDKETGYIVHDYR